MGFLDLMKELRIKKEEQKKIKNQEELFKMKEEIEKIRFERKSLVELASVRAELEFEKNELAKIKVKSGLSSGLGKLMSNIAGIEGVEPVNVKVEEKESDVVRKKFRKDGVV